MAILCSTCHPKKLSLNPLCRRDRARMDGHEARFAGHIPRDMSKERNEGDGRSQPVEGRMGF